MYNFYFGYIKQKCSTFATECNQTFSANLLLEAFDQSPGYRHSLVSIYWWALPPLLFSVLFHLSVQTLPLVFQLVRTSQLVSVSSILIKKGNLWITKNNRLFYFWKEVPEHVKAFLFFFFFFYLEIRSQFVIEILF